MTAPDGDLRTFASDNAAGIHPTVLAAIERANRGHAVAYGHDPWTDAATERFREIFGVDTDVLFVFGGTAANVLALRPFVDSYQSVICASSSHLWIDECAAGERFLGGKLVPIDTPDGKLTPALVRPALSTLGPVHHAQPRAISVAQPTEWGTLYDQDELAALAELAHAHDMILHVDGARLSNAAAAMNLPLSAFGKECGVDVLSFGGTKCGLLAGEAIIYFNRDIAHRAGYYRKQAMQLASKMRFLAAQMNALLTNDLWRELASHANAMAARLAAGLTTLPGVELAQPVQTNAIFAVLPEEHVTRWQRHGYFHDWDRSRRIYRLMTAWDTQADQVDTFIEAIHVGDRLPSETT